MTKVLPLLVLEKEHGCLWYFFNVATLTFIDNRMPDFIW